MKKIELKSNYNIVPLLNELNEISLIKKQNNEKEQSGIVVRFKNNDVSFVDPISYNKVESILISLLKFNSSISNYSKSQIIRHAMNKIVLNEISTKDGFLEIINKEYTDYYKGKRNTTFHLLASLSINDLPFTTLKLKDKCTIQITGSSFPDKFIEQRAKKYQKKYRDLEDSGLLKIKVSVEDRDIFDAFDKAFSYMELFRGFLCLTTTPWQLINSTKPINKIVYGGFYTMHDDTGKNANDDLYWYDPNKINIEIQKIEDINSSRLKSQTETFISQYNKCQLNHRNKIKNAVEQYVTAYDQINKESCFINAWTALENLIGTHQYDKIINRCLVGHEKNNPMFKLELDALKKYRDELVHETNISNEHDSEVLTNCNMLFRYIAHHIKLNLKLAGKIKSTADYASYLDYLYNRNAIKSLDERYTDFNLIN